MHKGGELPLSKTWESTRSSYSTHSWWLFFERICTDRRPLWEFFLVIFANSPLLHSLYIRAASWGCEKFIWYIQFKINTCKMNWICKRLGIVYLPPAIDSSCCNRFPNYDDLLWMVYYWRKKKGRSRVWDHMWNIYMRGFPSYHVSADLPHPPLTQRKKCDYGGGRGCDHFRITPSWWWTWRRHGVVITFSH